jgi:FkbM family methyltransferase
MLGNRKLGRIVAAPFQPRNYLALLNMARLSPQRVALLRAYLTGAGRYPLHAVVRTPVGSIDVKLHSSHDVLTLNEIFFREDYRCRRDIAVVVDIGSNIGISALYFLSRNQHSRCYCFEPDPRNVAKLHENLAPFEGRYELSECAVSDVDRMVDFGIEATGRYGGIDVRAENTIRVRSLAVNDVVADILDREGKIDLIKIDTEGLEEPTVRAIEPEHLARIETILFEAPEKTGPLHPGFYEKHRRGHVERLVALESEA